MKAFRCGGPDGAPSDGDGTTLARAAARFREQQPNSPSISATQAQMDPTRNISLTKKSEFGAGITLSGAADSAEGLGRLCGVGPGPTARATIAAVTGGPPNRRERTTKKI